MKGRKTGRRFLSVLLTLVMFMTMFSMPAVSADNIDTKAPDYRIVHVDAGRKYFSVDNIKSIIDTASAAGFNYLELAVGNDGLRYLLDDMSVTVGETRYSSEDVTAAIQYANKKYYDAGDKNELTQAEMDTIIAYANSKGMEILPLLNTPGHMNAIVSAMVDLGIDGDYNGSANTIDITNETAVAFTKALVQKYVTYFAGKGCSVFNFGADEYANDKYSTGGMGFAQLVSAGQYDEFVTYVNSLAAMVKNAGMTPMAFNDGIYYNSNTATAIDTDILVAYWTCGWGGYNVASASFLSNQGFKLINTNGDYYWVLGKTNAQCSAEKAAGFDVNTFIGNNTISGTPAGAMFCIWCDVPGADTADNVVTNTAAVITAFGGAIYSGETASDTTVTTSFEGTAISVTGPGLISVAASAGNTEVEIAGAEDYRIYDITPQTKSGAYTASASVSIPIPEDWNTTGKNIKGFVVNTDNSITLIDGSEENGVFTFVCPHFSDAGIALMSNNIINVVAGGTATATIEGVNLSNKTPVVSNNNVVTNVSVDGTDEQEATTAYTEASVTCNDLISSNESTWQATGYYYQVNENYYPLYAQRNRQWVVSSFYYFYSYGYSTTNSANDVTRIGSTSYNQAVTNVNSTSNITVYSQSGTEAVPASTTVTFTASADAAGQSTTVTIGNVTYTVNVTAVDLSAVTPITIEWWATNSHIYETAVNNGNGTWSTTVTADMAGITSEDGVAISALVPDLDCYRGTDPDYIYWRTRLLNRSTDEQTEDPGDDETLDGTGITRVRYDVDTGTWLARNSDSGEWITVTDTTSTYQIVAFYMKRMDIKNATTGLTEVYAMSADWGAKADGTEQTYSGDNYNAATVSVQIVYEDGSTNPGTTTASDLKTYTFTYDHWDPRGLGTIGFSAANGYQIYRVTAETGEVWNTSGTQKLNDGYFNAGNFEWDDNEETVWESENPVEAATVSNPHANISFEPPLDNLTWDWTEHNDNNAILLRVYVRVVATEDTLNVHYIDDTSGSEFYDYSIAVKEGTLFNEQIGLSNGAVINGSVTNYVGATQTVTADLSTMPQISAAYRERSYTCVSVVRSDDGKDVYLHYTFDDTHPVVYDYGLPITLTAADMEINNVSSIELASIPKYGNVTVDGTSVTYTSNTMSPQVEEITLNCTFAASGDTQAATVKTILQMIPATTVYYEDNSGLIEFTNGWTSKSETQSGIQAYNTTPYGYDAAYTGSGNYSNGSAHTVTIAVGEAAQTATFTFTGTGFDLYSQTGKNNGLLSIKVVNDAGEMVKNTSVLNTGNVTLYQIPVYTVKNLTYDTYTVTVTAFAEYTNKNYPALSQGGYHVIDAVQIYNPLAAEGTQYKTDNEANAVRLKVRDAIIDAETYNSAGGDSGNGVLYINADSVADNGGVIDYTLVGPNNEAYLADTGSVIGFILETSSPVKTLQIGAKSADGKLVTMNATVNEQQNTATINTATAMNYKLEELGTPTDNDGKCQYTVYISKSNGDGILSITDVKATFTSASDAEFKYNKAVAEGADIVDETDSEATIQENGVTVTTNRVRYGRTMTMEIVTDGALAEGQSFTVKAGSRTYTEDESGLNRFTVSEGKANSDGSYTYTLQLKPYTYRLIGNTNFVVSLTDSSGSNVISTQTISVRVTLL